MGEVWKANDTRLGRVVAIKFCQSRFSDRFDREAKVIAALNHLNIAQIYDVGENYIVIASLSPPRPTGGSGSSSAVEQDGLTLRSSRRYPTFPQTNVTINGRW